MISEMIATFTTRMPMSSRLRTGTTSAARGSSSRSLQSWANKLLKRSARKSITCCSHLASNLAITFFADQLLSPSAPATSLFSREESRSTEGTARARHRRVRCASDALVQPRNVPWKRSSGPTIKHLLNLLASMAFIMIKKQCWMGQMSTLRSEKSEHIS